MLLKSCSLIILLSMKLMFITSQDDCEPMYERSVSEMGISMLWIDNRFRTLSCPFDTFFDRMVGITSRVPDKKRRHRLPAIATGVMISETQILTSFNAFRLLMLGGYKMKDFNVLVLTTRVANKDRDRVVAVLFQSWRNGRGPVSCGRQVVPETLNLSAPVFHGVHSPLHDLMVFATLPNETFQLLSPAPKRSFNLKDYYLKDQKHFPSYGPGPFYSLSPFTGPIKTELARENDQFGDEILIASLGHRTKWYMYEHRYMERAIYKIEDKVIVDCDEWIPRNWGHFICVLNVDRFEGMAAGGMLFSREKLFGVGCFALFKGTKSILVFTDVRRYWDLIINTCILEDRYKVS